MNGKLTKNASGYNSYEIYEADQDFIFNLADILTEQFGFDFTKTHPVMGLDEIFWDAEKEGVLLTVGWDIWSGAFVSAQCLQGNLYIENLASFFEKIYFVIPALSRKPVA